ncbi:phosphotransferase family protein [Nonomuraea sp. NPDC050663]|uniref:phosphotransferase family protein n=1 Tax=Nonomuraea sp. NPDC050663 TaxID=3364370 RepID=UPI00378E9E55
MSLEDELTSIADAFGGAGEPVLFPSRTDVMVLRQGGVVVKAHSDREDPGGLELRLRAAASAPLHGLLLAPLQAEVLRVGGRNVTVWPAGQPVTDPEHAPWEEGARLLARLHAVPLSALPPLPPAGGPLRAARAVNRLTGDSPAEKLVRQAFEGLPPFPDGPGLLTHGDWHLGQLVHRSHWLLIDVDDLGVGDPAWDLARPAAWYAAGLLEGSVWDRFLGAYLAAGGPAVDAADPWSRLDMPARALTAQLAAVALDKALRDGREPDEVEQSLIEACGRIVGLQKSLR